MGDGNFASSPTAFTWTKRARNSAINHGDNDPITPSFIKALEIINNSPGNSIEDDEWLSLRCYWKINHQELQQQKDVTSLVGLDLNTTSLPMLPSTEQSCGTFRNQYDDWLFWHLYWKTTPFYDESANHQGFQQQENVTPTHVEQVLESFEETWKAKERK
ncbi:hypothetical protein QN277_001738 [Acacia crassicarpa]|uniref:Uncharacterized protein n=1 Tax=Acacia crassicarpa TaxID=499986 RepID=A0AAE1N937_9FABA|nr:hypothetical protein QN277_001738 [Acacia crassicarpa]